MILSNGDNAGSIIDSMYYDHAGRLIKRLVGWLDELVVNTVTGAGLVSETHIDYNASGKKIRTRNMIHVKTSGCWKFCPWIEVWSADIYVYDNAGVLLERHYSDTSSFEPNDSHLQFHYGPLGLMRTTFHPTSSTTDSPIYYHYDYKGTLRSKSTSGASPIGGRMYYLPYGEFFSVIAADTRMYYQGGESDQTTFIHMGARYYDATLGRFLSPDPLDASPSTYSYALNNPIMYTDPGGLASGIPAGGSEIFAMPPRHNGYITMGGSPTALNRGKRLHKTKSMIGAETVFQEYLQLRMEDAKKAALRAANSAVRAQLDADKIDPRNPPAEMWTYRYDGQSYGNGDIIEDYVSKTVTVDKFGITTTTTHTRDVSMSNGNMVQMSVPTTKTALSTTVQFQAGTGTNMSKAERNRIEHEVFMDLRKQGITLYSSWNNQGDGGGAIPGGKNGRKIAFVMESDSEVKDLTKSGILKSGDRGYTKRGSKRGNVLIERIRNDKKFPTLGLFINESVYISNIVRHEWGHTMGIHGESGSTMYPTTQIGKYNMWYKTQYFNQKELDSF